MLGAGHDVCPSCYPIASFKMLPFIFSKIHFFFLFNENNQEQCKLASRQREQEVEKCGQELLLFCSRQEWAASQGLVAGGGGGMGFVCCSRVGWEPQKVVGRGRTPPNWILSGSLGSGWGRCWLWEDQKEGREQETVRVQMGGRGGEVAQWRAWK